MVACNDTFGEPVLAIFSNRERGRVDLSVCVRVKRFSWRQHKKEIAASQADLKYVKDEGRS
jgi:hypothetical protein